MAPTTLIAIRAVEVALIAPLAVLAFGVLKRVLPWRKHRPLYTRKQLLTPTEAAFYTALRAATPSRYQVFTHVRLGDLVTASRQHGRDEHWRANQDHVDFVICDPEMKPITCIELDDRTHDNPKRRMRDNLKTKALTEAGYTFHRIRAAAAYDPRTLERFTERL